MNYTKKKTSIKKLILILLLVGPILAFALIALISYQSMSSMLSNKTLSTIEDNLSRFSACIQDTMDDLSQVVYQLVDGSVGDAILQLEYTTGPYAKVDLTTHINKQMELLAFTHSNIRLMTYYRMNEGTYQFESESIPTPFHPENFTVMTIKNKLVYYSPHESCSKYNPYPVISLMRKLDYSIYNDFYVYIEADFNYYKTEENMDIFDQKDFFLILNKDNQILYSGNSQIIPTQQVYGSSLDNLSEYYVYEDHTKNFSVVYLVPKAEYNKERSVWTGQMLLIFIVFAFFCAWSVIVMWRTIYRPIQHLENEIKWIRQGNLATIPNPTGVAEFDQLLDELARMKGNLAELIQEVKEDKRHQADLEIEKLLYQINPHFLMNSLNTVHWIAVMNKQPQISQLVAALNKLLSYNLKRNTLSVPLRDEIDALQQYLHLQRIRYDFEYSIDYGADELILDVPLPRFILQPLVENAIYHGIEENGKITVSMQLLDKLIITVTDNGIGMSEEECTRLLESSNTAGQGEMGIGLGYVFRILQSRYGERASLDISSTPKIGTTVILHIPFKD